MNNNYIIKWIYSCKAQQSLIEGVLKEKRRRRENHLRRNKERWLMIKNNPILKKSEQINNGDDEI